MTTNLLHVIANQETHHRIAKMFVDISIPVLISSQNRTNIQRMYMCIFIGTPTYYACLYRIRAR